MLINKFNFYNYIFFIVKIITFINNFSYLYKNLFTFINFIKNKNVKKSNVKGK